MAEAQCRQYLSDQGITEIEDPAARLVELLAEADAFYRFMRDKVAGVDVDSWESSDDKGAVHLTVYVELLERAMDRLQKFLFDVQRLGLAERQVQLAEAHADAINAVIEGVLRAVGLDAQTLARARAEVPRQLRALSA